MRKEKNTLAADGREAVENGSGGGFFVCTSECVYVLTGRWTGACIHVSEPVCQLPAILVGVCSFLCVSVGLGCHRVSIKVPS